MPELPEVETVLHGIAPHITGKTVAAVRIRQPKLRWPVPPELSQILAGETVRQCSRRAKYLLIRFDTGVLLVHLGMSGSIRIYRSSVPEPGKHDHADIQFADGTLLRYRDPRRFGAILWHAGAAEHHPLLQNLGPEPLTSAFSGSLLHSSLKNQSRPIKTALMDNATVVGIGNIYANESLFQAAISPLRPANTLTQAECETLVQAAKQILRCAIKAGGSTLRDFADSTGHSGYFQQEYKVYGRNGEACPRCGAPIVKTTIGQRGTFHCTNCQT